MKGKPYQPLAIAYSTRAVGMDSLLERHKPSHHLLRAVPMSARQDFTRRRHIDLARVASAFCRRAA